MTASRVRSRRRALTASSLAPLALLNGCATLGGNVKGSFSCQAPNGVCAPSSTIDDRALAMISGDAGDMAIPAGPYVPPPSSSRKTTIAAARTLPATGTARSNERVLRVVFQPYFDEFGRLHEASAVRTVVRGEWQAAEVPVPVQTGVDPRPAGGSLAEAVDHAEPPLALAAADPDLPDPAAVAAARARRTDPVAAIKADVAARLAVSKRRAPARRARTSATGRFAAATRAKAPAPVTVSSGIPAQPGLPGVSAEAAAARVRSDPRWTSAAAATPGAARSAAATTGAPAMRATSFPGVTSEEN